MSAKLGLLFSRRADPDLVCSSLWSDKFLASRLDNASTLVIVLCAIVVTGLTVRRELAAPSRGATDAPTEIVDWHEYARGAMQIGDSNAVVTITEFSDFQCPYCKTFAQLLQRVRGEHPGKIRLVYRNFPIPALHPHARAAALAAECAADQGRFEAFHDLVFANQDSIGRMRWSHAALRAGVPDTVAFLGCLASPATVLRLTADSLAAARLGVGGTPAILVNKWMFFGAPSESTFRKVVRRELE